MASNLEHELRRPGAWLLVLFAATVGLAGAMSSSRTHALLWRTTQLSAAAMLVAIPIGTWLAWTMVRTDLPARRLLGGILLFTVAMPLYLQAAAWNAGFGQQGWWQLSQSGLASEPLLFGFRGAALVHGLAAIPWTIFIVGAELWLARRDQEEAALLDGSQGQVALTITAPRMAMAALAAMLWIAVTIAGEITVTDLYQVRTYAEELYVGFAIDTLEGDSTVGPATMGALPGMIMLAGLTLGLFFVGWQLWWRAGTLESLSEPRRVRLGRWRWPMLASVLLVLFLLVDLPLLNLFYKCGVTVEQVGEARVRGWSFGKAMTLLTTAPFAFREEIGWSLAISQLSSLLALSMAVPLAWWARGRSAVGVASEHLVRWRIATIGLLAAVLLAIPGPLLALAVIRIFQASESDWVGWLYSHSIAAPTIVLTLKTLPIVLLVTWHGFASIASETTEAARLAGARFWNQLFSIGIPQRSALLLSAWLIGVILSLGDVTSSILTVPPGVTTVAIRIFGLMHYGVEDKLAAICLAMVAIIAILTALVGLLWRGQDKMR